MGKHISSQVISVRLPNATVEAIHLEADRRGLAVNALLGDFLERLARSWETSAVPSVTSFYSGRAQ